MTYARSVVAVALCAMTACLPLKSAPSPHGALVQVEVHDGTRRGELLAVSAESLWVAEPKRGVAEPTALPLTDVKRVVVQRGAGTGTFVGRGVLFGVGTGLGMFVACTSVSEGCGGVMVVSVAVPSVLALLAGSEIAAKRQRTFTAVTADSLAPFARWPQGRPTDVPRSP